MVLDWYQYTRIVHVLAIKDILEVTPCLMQKLMLTFSFHFDFNCILKVQQIRTQIQKKHENTPWLSRGLLIYVSTYPGFQPTYMPT
jgi:hypothetical protein